MKNITTILICVFFANFSFAQPLDTLVALLKTNNLQLKSLEIQQTISNKDALQIQTRPDPVFGIGIFPLPVETRLGAQWTRLSVMQNFPWFGLVDKQKELVNTKTDIIKYESDNTVLNLVNIIQKNYITIYGLEAKKLILDENYKLLDGLEKLTLSKVELGKLSMSDVLLIQQKKEDLNIKIALLDAQISIPTASINQILQRPLETRIQIDTTSFVYPENVDFEQEVNSEHPKLAKVDVMANIAEQSIELNRIKQKPSFGIGADYIYVSDRKDIDPAHNGRDILQIKGSIKIPLYKEKYNAKEEQELLKIKDLDIKKENILSKLEMQIVQLKAQYQKLQLELNYYPKQMKLIHHTISIMETNFSVNKGNLESLLLQEMKLVDYKLKYLNTKISILLIGFELEKIYYHE